VNAQTTVTGTVERIVHGGDALLRSESGLFLVNNGVPGDLLLCQPLGQRRGMARAAIREILTPSPQRIAPACAVAGHCGGCALQFLAPGMHAEIKSAWVREAFAPYLDATTIWKPVDPAHTGLRRRLRWWRGEDAQGPFLGFRAAASHAVVRQQSCPVVEPQLVLLRQSIESLLPPAVQSLQATLLADGIHALLEGEREAPPMQLPHALGDLPVQWWWRHGERVQPLTRPVLRLHDRLPVGADGDLLLEVGPEGFVQGQAAGNRAMVQQAIEWCRAGERVADLFCGIGNFSLPLAAARHAEVNGAELNAASVQLANANARRLGLAAHYRVTDLLSPKADLSPCVGAGLLLLDPPRKGAKQICSSLGRLLPQRILLVSCDAAAGRRDGELLQQAGFRLCELAAFDLFTGAGHVEAMSLWERA